MAKPLVVILAGLAGAAALASPPAPTGRATVDAVLVAGGVAAVVALAARAPSWTVLLAAIVSVAIAVDVPVVVAGGVAVAVALWALFAAGHRPVANVLAAGLAFNAIAWAGLGQFFGLSSIVGVTTAVVVSVAGVSRSSRTVRRWAMAGTVAVVVLAALASAAFARSAFDARHDLSDGVRSAEFGVAALERGDYEEARNHFADSAAALERAHEALDSPWTVAAGFVPVVAQHRDAAVDMSAAGAAGATTVTEALVDVDVDALRPVAGRIDLDAVAGVAAPLHRVHAALVELQDVVDRSSSPWLVGRAEAEIADFQVSIAEHLPQLENAIDASALAPQLLGAEGRRTYLVLFTTPAEARGLGGFVGSYAELRADDGSLELAAVGRASELDTLAAAQGVRIEDHAEFLDRYGSFGYDDEGAGDGLVGGTTLRRLTMTPNFPWVAEMAQQVYADVTGRTVDGVLLVDPYVVARLLRYTGPVELATVDQRLDEGNAAWYLMFDQYVLGADDNDQRVDALGEAASLTAAALFGGTMPGPVTLAADLSPLVTERRLLAWSADPVEQELFQRVHLSGEMPALDGRDGWSVAVSNLGGSKIDSMLVGTTSYDSATDANGSTTATLSIDLENSAPADGLPRYVIGNDVGLPFGTSRLYVSAYSALTLVGATVDGVAVELEAGTEVGWNVYAATFDIPAGETITLELELRGRVPRPDDVVTWTQPLTWPLLAEDG